MGINHARVFHRKALHLRLQFRKRPASVGSEVPQRNLVFPFLDHLLPTFVEHLVSLVISYRRFHMQAEFAGARPPPGPFGSRQPLLTLLEAPGPSTTFAGHCPGGNSCVTGVRGGKCGCTPLWLERRKIAEARGLAGRTARAYRVRANRTRHSQPERSSSGPKPDCSGGEVISAWSSRAQASRRAKALSHRCATRRRAPGQSKRPSL